MRPRRPFRRKGARAAQSGGRRRGRDAAREGADCADRRQRRAGADKRRPAPLKSISARAGEGTPARGGEGARGARMRGGEARRGEQRRGRDYRRTCDAHLLLFVGAGFLRFFIEGEQPFFAVLPIYALPPGTFVYECVYAPWPEPIYEGFY